MTKRLETIAICIEEETLKKIDEMAKKVGAKRSGYIRAILKRYVEEAGGVKSRDETQKSPSHTQDSDFGSTESQGEI